TPAIKTVEQLEKFLRKKAETMAKTLFYIADETRAAAVMMRGDQEVNEVKLKNILGAKDIKLADATTIFHLTGAPVGFAGPINLQVGEFGLGLKMKFMKIFGEETQQPALD